MEDPVESERSTVTRSSRVSRVIAIERAVIVKCSKMHRIVTQGDWMRGRARLEERIFNGYSYIFYREKDDVKFVRCKNAQTHNCRALGNIANGVFTLTKPHNHESIQGMHLNSVFLTELRRATLTEMRGLSSIYSSVKTMYPEAAAHFDKNTVIKRMAAWRAVMKPPVPQTYTALRDTLYSIEWRVFRLMEPSIIQVALNEDNNEQSMALVFYDRDLIEQLAARCTELHINTTVRVLPNHFHETKQLVTVIAVYRGHAFLCVCAWLRSCDQAAYAAVLGPIIGVIRPDRIYDNFEARLREKITLNFPLRTIKGSFNSYCTTLLGEAKSQGLNIAEDVHLQTTIKKLMALPLLPAHQIQAAFDSIKDAEPPEFAESLAGLFQYFNQTWLQIVTPDQLTIHGDLCAISDCAISSVNVLENKLDGNTNIWNFIRALLKTFSRSHADIRRFNRRLLVTVTPLSRPLISKSALRRTWRLLQLSKINQNRFLEICCTFLDPLLANLLFRDDPPREDFQPIRAAENEPENADIDAQFPPLNLEDDPNEEEEFNAPLGALEDDEPNDELNDEPNDAPNNARAVKCVVCLVNDVNYTCLPCIHVAFCRACATRCAEIAVRQQQPLRCPLCRDPATGFQRAYIYGRN